MQLNVLDLCSGLGGLSSAFTAVGHNVITLDFDPKFKCDLTMDVREFAEDPVGYLGVIAAAKFGKNGQAYQDWTPDIILDGTPCDPFSVASIGHHWGGGHRAYEPKTEAARLGIEVAKAGLMVFEHYPNAMRVMENPRGLLRKMEFMKVLGEPTTVEWCQYGDTCQKATDIWHNLKCWTPAPRCKARAKHGVMDTEGNSYVVHQIGSGKMKTFELEPSTMEVSVAGFLPSTTTHFSTERINVPRDGLPTLNGRKEPLRVMDVAGRPCHQWSARGFKTGTQGKKDAATRAVIPYQLSMSLRNAAEKEFGAK